MLFIDNLRVLIHCDTQRLDIVQNLCEYLVILTHKDFIKFKNPDENFAIENKKKFFCQIFFETNVPKYIFENI